MQHLSLPTSFASFLPAQTLKLEVCNTSDNGLDMEQLNPTAEAKGFTSMPRELTQMIVQHVPFNDFKNVVCIFSSSLKSMARLMLGHWPTSVSLLRCCIPEIFLFFQDRSLNCAYFMGLPSLTSYSHVIEMAILTLESDTGLCFSQNPRRFSLYSSESSSFDSGISTLVY